MLRYLWMLVPLSLFSAGCRSQYGCSPFGPTGTRVPPPATGSFGTGNTYYPAAVPRATATPSTAPRALNPSSGWRTSTDDGSRMNSLADGSAADASGSGENNQAVRIATEVTPTVRVPRTDSVRPRLNGMPINEARPAVSPASFDEPVTGGGTGSGLDVGRRSAQSISSPVPSGKSPANGLRDSSAGLGSDVWQSRPTPAPNRIAGS